MTKFQYTASAAVCAAGRAAGDVSAQSKRGKPTSAAQAATTAAESVTAYAQMHSGLDTIKKAIKCRCGGVGAQSAVLVTCMFTLFRVLEWREHLLRIALGQTASRQM